jgi:3D (Asp-Asp-Asp) domain-containing protein
MPNQFYLLLSLVITAATLYMCIHTIIVLAELTSFVPETKIEIQEESTPEKKPIDPPDDQFVATVTAYTSSPDETDNTPHITASGARTREGIIACPRKYEFGTLFYIEGKGLYECQDRTHPRFDDRFDIWMKTKKEAFKWGVQQRKITIKSYD